MSNLSTRQKEERDLTLAVAVQKALLQGGVPKCRCGRLVAKNQMCQGVGGDFYYFLELNPDQVAFLIGDAVGHGMAAALLMSQVTGLVRGNRQDQSRPSKMVGQINDWLMDLNLYMEYPLTCSLFYGVVDLPSRNLFYVNAGHPHPLVYNPRQPGIHSLSATTMLLGVTKDVRPESCHQFSPKDRLILFTDGVIEARNPQGAFFGKDRFKNILEELEDKDIDDLAEQVFNEIEEFTQGRESDDDRSMIIIEFSS